MNLFASPFSYHSQLIGLNVLIPSVALTEPGELHGIAKEDEGRREHCSGEALFAEPNQDVKISDGSEVQQGDLSNREYLNTWQSFQLAICKGQVWQLSTTSGKLWHADGNT